MFLPAAVREGEWWRVFTHPFIHVTWFQGKCFLPLVFRVGGRSGGDNSRRRGCGRSGSMAVRPMC